MRGCVHGGEQGPGAIAPQPQESDIATFLGKNWDFEVPLPLPASLTAQLGTAAPIFHVSPNVPTLDCDLLGSSQTVHPFCTKLLHR